VKPLPPLVKRYLDRQGSGGHWALSGSRREGLRGAVVIPALAEGESLFATLKSLDDNPEETCLDWLVLVVINQRTDALAVEQQQNLDDLEKLADFAENYRYPLAWVDAVSPGFELPTRHGGVGLARKIGMDLALPRLDWGRRPLLACLDADTLVEPTYLPALEAHFQDRCGGAVLPFRHQPAGEASQQEAIDRYELFLRAYVLGLSLAGSPYAYASVGSAMACTAHAYAQCSGMNRRRAAEDFHFLNKLAKTAGVAPLQGTKVHPAPRISSRVPFGTGRSMARQLAGEVGVVRFYPLGAFEIVGSWLQLVTKDPSLDAAFLWRQAAQLSPTLGQYLNDCGWHEAWSSLQANHPSSAPRLRAFHAWFDGLRTLRLVHALCDSLFQRSENPQILGPLLAACGLQSPSNLSVPLALEQLRRVQGEA